MPAAHARVATTRPSRYLIQLCRHVDHLSGHTDRLPRHRQADPEPASPEPPAHVSWSDTAGVIHVASKLTTSVKL